MNAILNTTASNSNFKLHVLQLDIYQQSNNILLQDILILTCSDSSTEYKAHLKNRFGRELSVFTLMEYCRLMLNLFVDSIEGQENLSLADQARIKRLNIEIQNALHSDEEVIKMMQLLFSQFSNHIRQKLGTYQSIFVSELKSATQHEIEVVKMFESFFNFAFTTMHR